MDLAGALPPFAEPVRTPAFGVLVEGIPLPPAALGAIHAVTVTQQENAPADFKLQVHDPNLLLIEAADGLLAEGRRIEIAMGYAGALLPMMEGAIDAIDVSLDEDGGLALSVEGFDGLHAGTRATGSRSFPDNTSDSAIVRRIAPELLPTAVVAETVPRATASRQDAQTTLAFLQQLAQDNDFQLWAEGRTLFFLPLRPGPAVVFARRRNLIAFSARLSTAGQVGEVEVRTRDVARDQAVTATASVGLSADFLGALSATGLVQVLGQALGLGAAGSKLVVHAEGRAANIQEAQTLADSTLAARRRQLLTAHGSVIGDPQVRVGSIVTLLGMGRFSLGLWTIQRVTHRIDQSGYRTDFTMRQIL